MSVDVGETLKEKVQNQIACNFMATLEIAFFSPILPEYAAITPNNTCKGYFPTHKHAFSVHECRTGFGKKYKSY